jgi:glycosyltransferase involved in cell wall biosynthesis
LLDTFARLPPERHIVFLGDGPLVNDVESFVARHTNIHRLPSVPVDELLDYTGGADVGISLIENVSLSYYYSLPNKVFEYIMSGVPVVVSDFPEMARLVLSGNCGWTSRVDRETFFRLVGSLTRSEIEARAKGARELSRRTSWANEEKALLDIYATVLPR